MKFRRRRRKEGRGFLKRKKNVKKQKTKKPGTTTTKGKTTSSRQQIQFDGRKKGQEIKYPSAIFHLVRSKRAPSLLVFFFSPLSLSPLSSFLYMILLFPGFLAPLPGRHSQDVAVFKCPCLNQLLSSSGHKRTGQASGEGGGKKTRGREKPKPKTTSSTKRVFLRWETFHSCPDLVVRCRILCLSLSPILNSF